MYGIARATGIRINQSIADAIAAYIIYRLGIKTSDKSSLDLKPKDIAILKAIPSFEMELKRIKKTHRQEKTKHQPPPSNVISIGAVASSSPARGTNTSSSGALHIVSPFKSSGTEFSVNADIHGVGKRLEAARARLSGLEHSKLLLKFLDHLESLGLSKARVLKYANHLSKIFRYVAFDPSAATKHDIERVVAWINRQPYREWTKHSLKMAFKLCWSPGRAQTPSSGAFMATLMRLGERSLKT